MVVVDIVTGFMVVVVVVTVVILVFVVLCCVMFVVVVVVVYWLAQINPIGRCRSSIQLHTAGCLKVLSSIQVFFQKIFQEDFATSLYASFQGCFFQGQKRLGNFQ